MLYVFNEDCVHGAHLLREMSFSVNTSDVNKINEKIFEFRFHLFLELMHSALYYAIYMDMSDLISAIVSNVSSFLDSHSSMYTNKYDTLLEFVLCRRSALQCPSNVNRYSSNLLEVCIIFRRENAFVILERFLSPI